MSIDDFVGYSKALHGMTVDFVRAAPKRKRDFMPDPPGKSGRAAAPNRIGDGFAPFCKQLRHASVCAASTILRPRPEKWIGYKAPERITLATNPETPWAGSPLRGAWQIRDGICHFLAFLTNPSSLHSSEPTPLCTKNNPVGSYFFFTAARRA
jgi:hypothetical protein